LFKYLSKKGEFLSAFQFEELI